MERNLPTTNKKELQLGSGRGLTKKQDAIGKLLFDINMLIKYPLQRSELEDWAVQIDRVRPDLPMDVIRFVIDKFSTDELKWDHNKGIQNIFIGLNSVFWCPNEKKLKLVKAR